MKHSVLAGYLHPNRVSHSFMESLWSVADYEREHRDLLWRRFAVRSGPYLDKSRNAVARVFLDQSSCDWLWFVDTDMGFEPDTLSRLVDLADPVERPVVGALYYGQIDGKTDGMGGWETRKFPLVYSCTNGVFHEAQDFPDDSLIQVAGTGGGCLLIHRSVLEGLRAAYGGDTWFDYLWDGRGERLGEDLSFFARLAEQEVPAYVHTGIKTTHHKEVWLTKEIS